MFSIFLRYCFHFWKQFTKSVLFLSNSTIYMFTCSSIMGHLLFVLTSHTNTYVNNYPRILIISTLFIRMICQNTRNIYLNEINTNHVFGGGKNIYWYNKHIVYIKLPLMDFTIKIWKQSECFNSFWKKLQKDTTINVTNMKIIVKLSLNQASMTDHSRFRTKI